MVNNVGYFIAFMIGGIFGALTICLMVAAKAGDN
jgi:uncharacterized membrane protein YiaA